MPNLIKSLALLVVSLLLGGCASSSPRAPTSEMVYQNPLPAPEGYHLIEELDEAPRVLNGKEIYFTVEYEQFMQFLGRMYFGQQTYLFQVRLMIGTDGKVQDAQILEANVMEGQEQARRFLLKYQLTPGQLKGLLVPYYVEFGISPTVEMQERYPTPQILY